jgi:hypothetical protein
MEFIRVPFLILSFSNAPSLPPLPPLPPSLPPSLPSAPLSLVSPPLPLALSPAPPLHLDAPASIFLREPRIHTSDLSNGLLIHQAPLERRTLQSLSGAHLNDNARQGPVYRSLPQRPAAHRPRAPCSSYGARDLLVPRWTEVCRITAMPKSAKTG